jgi:hypothetical protein
MLGTQRAGRALAGTRELAATPLNGLTRPVTVAAGGVLLLAAAYEFSRSSNQSAVILIPPLVAVGFLVRRWPATAMVAVFAMSGAYGSLKAFFSFPANGLSTALAAGFVIAAAAMIFFGRRQKAIVIWPAAVAILLYVIAVVAMLPFSPDQTSALKVVRSAGLQLLVILPIAYAPWPKGTHERARQAIVLVAFAVGAYAALRWQIGASGKEKAQITSTVFNTAAGQNKVIGSFPSGVELGAWTAAVIPFLLATFLTRRGALRFIALAALPLCAIGLLGSGLRIGLVAAAAGCGVVLVAYALSRGMPPTRYAVIAVVTMAMAGGAVAIFPLVIHDPATVQRYREILHPSTDPSVQFRLDKWKSVLLATRGHPFGHGLGTIGPDSQNQPFISTTPTFVDSAYLLIAYDQGLWAMGLFGAVILLLLAGLLRRAIWTRDRTRAGPAIAAAGTLVAWAMILGFDLLNGASMGWAPWLIVALGMAPFTRLERQAPAAALPAA